MICKTIREKLDSCLISFKTTADQVIQQDALDLVAKKVFEGEFDYQPAFKSYIQLLVTNLGRLKAMKSTQLYSLRLKKFNLSSGRFNSTLSART